MFEIKRHCTEADIQNEPDSSWSTVWKPNIHEQLLCEEQVHESSAPKKCGQDQPQYMNQGCGIDSRVILGTFTRHDLFSEPSTHWEAKLTRTDLVWLFIN